VIANSRSKYYWPERCTGVPNMRERRTRAATTSRRLWSLFQIILAEGVLVGCGGVSRDDFTEDTCTGGTFDPLTAIEPRDAVDYLEVFGPNGAPTSRGVKCEKALDQKACLAGFEALVNPTTPPTDRGLHSGQSGGTRIRFTRGDSVGEISTIEGLRGLMDAKSPKSAMMFAWAQGHNPVCGEKNAGPLDQNFVLLTHTGQKCGGDVDENRVSVTPKGEVTVVDTSLFESGDPNCQIGRRPEGFDATAYERSDFAEWLAALAELEAASVSAFERLATELELLGAPPELITRAKLSARDEVRHARVMSRLALEHGAREVPTPSVSHLALAPRSRLFEVIKENAIEGCLRETFGALIAAHQAQHAKDARIRSVMKMIARDETRHAALAWDVAEWAEERLTREERAEVRAERFRAIGGLRASLSTESLPADAITRAGMPNAEAAVAMFDHLIQRSSGRGVAVATATSRGH
jgi:hypothetical protein